MKIYDSIGPNPKLVRMFAAEKGFAFSEREEVDIMGAANRRAPYTDKNPAAQMPSVELDDGTVISETVTICELIEEQKPQPVLIGADEKARAETRMWTRRVEWQVVAPMTMGFRNAEGLGLFKSRIPTDPAAAPLLKKQAQEGLAWFDAQLAGRDTVVPGRFTLADVVLFVFVEFGNGVGQPADASLKNLAAWYEKTGGRESAKA